MKKADFIKLVASDVSLTQSEVNKVVDATFRTIVSVLADGEDKITISGFGSFEFKDRAPRTGRHPVTGEPIPIKAKRALTFKMSDTLSQILNE